MQARCAISLAITTFARSRRMGLRRQSAYWTEAGSLKVIDLSKFAGEFFRRVELGENPVLREWET